MNFNDIPAYFEWEAWENSSGNWEVKLLGPDGDTHLHLSEDLDAEEDRIEEGKFYLGTVDGCEPKVLDFIRERKWMEMGDGIIDADFVSLAKDHGRFRETQHNHRHLDQNVREGRITALTPA